MAEGTYEYECMRAELLGIEKPNQEEFERKRSERMKIEQEEQDAAEAKLLEEQEEALQNSGGKLDELNSILSSTQQKLNRFKQTACGSLSNIFSKGSVDVSDAAAPSSNTQSRRNTTASGGGNISIAAEDESLINQEIDESKRASNADIQPIIPTEKIRNAKMDIEKKMTSHLDKLDSLLNKAETAEVSMAEQTKQMRKIAK